MASGNVKKLTTEGTEGHSVTQRACMILFYALEFCVGAYACL